MLTGTSAQCLSFFGRQKILIPAARKRDPGSAFLRIKGFSKLETGRIIDAVIRGEGHPPESVFDFVQGIMTIARNREQYPSRPSRLRIALHAGGLPRPARGPAAARRVPFLCFAPANAGSPASPT